MYGVVLHGQRSYWETCGCWLASSAYNIIVNALKFDLDVRIGFDCMKPEGCVFHDSWCWVFWMVWTMGWRLVGGLYLERWDRGVNVLLMLSWNEFIYKYTVLISATALRECVI